MQDKHRVLFSGTADMLNVINCSINFYLYCIVNEEIRHTAINILKKFLLLKKTST